MIDHNSQKLATVEIAKHGAQKYVALQFIVEFYVQLFHDIGDACPFYRSAELQKDVDAISKRVRSSGLHFVSKVLPKLSIGLLDVLEGREPDYTGLRTDEHGYPLLCRDLTWQVLQNGEFSTQAFNCLYQLSMSFKKLREFADPSLASKTWQGYVEQQNEAKKFRFTPNSVTEIAANLVCGLFAKDDVFTSPYTVPGIGPGADYYHRHAFTRYYAHGWIPGLHDVFDPFEWHMPWALLDPQVNSSLIRNIYYPTVHGWKTHVLDEKKSRYKAVPKSYGVLRGISIMQNEVMFIQQAVRRYMAETISKSVDGNRLCFTKQEINASLALLGSTTGSNATLDAKSASDWVLNLVCEAVFYKCPNLWKALSAVRVPIVEYKPDSGPKQILEIESYAPMGSATCFPVMGTLIYCLSRAAILHTGRKNCLSASKRVYCYGDDLIVDREYYSIVVEALEYHGLKINYDKSYHASRFRESCGIHAFKGVDVTPVYVKYIPFLGNAGWSDERLQSHLAVERDLFSKGFLNTAAFLRNRINRELSEDLLYVHGDSPVIGFIRNKSDTSDAEQLVRFKKKRWNQKLQCYEFTTRVFPNSSLQCSLTSDHDAYLRYWSTKPDEKSSLLQIAWIDAANVAHQSTVTHSTLSACWVAM